MNLKQVCKWKLIAGVLVIWTIKLFIRPQAEAHTLANFILGIAPNLIGGYLLLFGSYLFFPLRFIFNSTLWRRMMCICFFALLVINEYFQKIPLFSRTFDYNDIAASALGLFFSYSVFVKLATRKMASTS